MEKGKMEITLKRKHLFLMSRILSKMELKVDFSNKNFEGKKLQTAIGSELMIKFLSNLHKAEEEADEFVLAATRYKKEELEDMDLDTYIEVWTGLLNNEKLKGFFKKALQ